MTGGLWIALDGMGGDNAPGAVVAGADAILERHPQLRFLIFGDEAQLKPLVAATSRLKGAAEIRHTDVVVRGDDKPSQALRKGRQSSMGLAIEAVKEGQAVGVVSAGNTGALMALAKFGLRTLAGIDRPAIASLLPTRRGESVMLDLGANIECDARNLVEFAVMGAQFARALLGRLKPTVGLLNVGSEEMKGHEELRQAAERLRSYEDLPFTFHGFIEGDDIGAGTVDVVVTDGFTGNVALKTAEGTAKLITNYMSLALRRSWTTRLGALLALPALRALRERLDPRQYNGGVFLGLNGITVKSHGGTDAIGFASAIDVAVDMARSHMVELIAEDIRRFPAHLLGPTQPAVAAT